MQDKHTWRDYAILLYPAVLAFLLVSAYHSCAGTPAEQERRRVDEIRSICADALDAGAFHD